MESFPEPARSGRTKTNAPRKPASTERRGVHARYDALASSDDSLCERGRLYLGPAPLPVVAARLASTLAEGCTIVEETSGAVRAWDDRALAALVRQGSFEARAAVRLAAPIECVDETDLLAVVRCLRLEQDMLGADVRAIWSLQAIDADLVLHSIDPAAPLAMLSDAITDYTQLQIAEPRLPRFPRRFAGELLRAGIVEITPGDTKVWGSFVEIGVRLGSGAAVRECERTIVFDRPSATWHVDE